MRGIGLSSVRAASWAFTTPGEITGARYWLPSEDQWYKAAYYDPTKNGTGGYWTYATQSDALPSYDETGTNSANYNDNRQKKGYKLTTVGTYVNSHSYYGA